MGRALLGLGAHSFLSLLNVLCSTDSAVSLQCGDHDNGMCIEVHGMSLSLAVARCHTTSSAAEDGTWVSWFALLAVEAQEAAICFCFVNATIPSDGPKQWQNGLFASSSPLNFLS